jgi:transglutaminase-like putative cysteine protease
MSGATTPADLAVTPFLDHDHPDVHAFVRRVTHGADDERAVVAALFRAVRDEVRYDPYRLSRDAGDYRASAVLAQGSAYCVPKAVALTAAARAAGVPARLGFADVRNHLQSDRLRAVMGTDLFVYHGYSLLYVEGQWRKASPAFNQELCARFGVPPLEFDGTQDALLHAFDAAGGKYMEYVTDHGDFGDLPFEQIMDTYARTYPALSADEHRDTSGA